MNDKNETYLKKGYKNNEQKHIDTISKDKMNFRVINYYPEDKFINRKYIEKRLFDVFKKYES
ncbi:MAG: hypothetical protein FWE04_03790 [Oscillospiraceae bacterium]|nr:hypothetical protein [Oscillospiraceae bacterium]